jgi:hypothetical protein
VLIDAPRQSDLANPPAGPHGFQVVDEEMLRSNPFAWFARHVMGEQGVIRHSGLDPRTATAAQIATALRPIFSNQSADNLANMIVGRWREWLGQTEIARLANLTPEARERLGSQRSWYQLNTARSALQDAMGGTAGNFKSVLNPALEMTV